MVIYIIKYKGRFGQDKMPGAALSAGADRNRMVFCINSDQRLRVPVVNPDRLPAFLPVIPGKELLCFV
jgi:hypothetical protein